MIGQFFDTMLVASIDNDASKSKSWNVLETPLSHLKAKPVDPKTYSPTSLYNPIQITC